MRPKYFKFLPWDYRPYGVPQDSDNEDLSVIFEKNDSLWFDIISSSKSGFFLSNYATTALLKDGLITKEEVKRCYPEKPILEELDNPFPDYQLIHLRHTVRVCTVQHNWPGHAEGSERTIVEDPQAARRLGVAADINKGGLVGLICDVRLLCIARKLRLTNFWFKPMDLPDHPSMLRPPFKIDYLGKQWPPQWYPNDLEPHVKNLTNDTLPEQGS